MDEYFETILLILGIKDFSVIRLQKCYFEKFKNNFFFIFINNLSLQNSDAKHRILKEFITIYTRLVELFFLA